MTYYWRSWDTPEQIREYEEQDRWWEEFLSHPENVENMKITEEKYRCIRVGVKFYCSHTKEEVDAELKRLSHEFMLKTANTDVTYLYKRAYPTEVFDGKP
jgi:hypothetical protein